MNPIFMQIWTSDGWMQYWLENRPHKNQRYYQRRSVVRMALWIPFFYGCAMIILSAVSVFQ